MDNDINKKLIVKLLDKHDKATPTRTTRKKICSVICKLRGEYDFTYALIAEYIKNEFDLEYSNTKIARCLKNNKLVNVRKKPNSTVKIAKTYKKDQFSEESKKTVFEEENKEEVLYGDNRIVEKGIFKGMTVGAVRKLPREEDEDGELTEKGMARLKVLSDYF